MRKSSSSLHRALARRLRDLGVDLEEYGGKTLIDCLVEQEAIIITVDTPHGPEWSYGWKNSQWGPIRKWALAYFDPE